MATTFNFDLLDLADGESGEAAVSVVVGKKKTQAAAAKVAGAADPAQPAAQEKPKYSYYARLQHDEGVRLCQQEQTKLKKALRKLREEETKLREQPGNEARLKELSDEFRKLRFEQRRLMQEEVKLKEQRDAFYMENGIPLPEEEGDKDKGTSNGANADPGSNSNGVNVNGYNNNGGGSCGYSDNGGNNDQNQTLVCDGGDERQFERGHDRYYNGERQEHHAGRKEYRIKMKPSSDAGTEPEHKVSSDSGTEAGTNSAVPASESSAGGAAQDGANNGQSVPTGTRSTTQKEKINGSEKRKKKKAKENSGNEPEKVNTQDSKLDGLKKQADQQPLPVYPKEEVKKTLAEYEKIREDKKKSSEPSKTEVRKVTAEEFEGMQILEKKKLDDVEAVIKAEKPQPKVKEASKKEVQAKGKEAAAKDAKPKKVDVSRQILAFKQPRRVTYNQEDGSFTSRFNGPFQGGNRDDSTKPPAFGQSVENGKAAQNEAGGNNGDGAPRGAYNGRGDGAPRGNFSGSRDGAPRGNGGYGYGRGNGGYGYGRGNSGYSGRGNGGYQGNGDYNQQQQGGNVGRFHHERAGNGGFYPQQQGGNVGRFHQDRAGNGGSYPQQGGHYQRRPGNDTYYQQRGNSGFHRTPSPAPAPAPAPALEDLTKFPALKPASARSAAPSSATASAPALAQSAAPTSAPAEV